jgi:hypothetical protein
MNGVHKNPQTVHLPGAEPLRADLLQQFKLATAPMLAALDPAALPPAALPGAPAPAAPTALSLAATAGAGSAAGEKRSVR